MSTVPTVTEAKVWSPDSLARAADAWELAAGDLQTEVDGVVRGVDSTQDLWTGSAADAMRDKARGVTAAGLLVAEALLTASVVARQGADRIGVARQEVLTLVDAAYAMGCVVADDGTVTPPETVPEEVLEKVSGNIRIGTWAMQAYSEQTSADIAAKLKTLGEVDAEVASQIDDAFASPGAGITPTGSAWTVPPADVVAGWATLSQDRIAAQIAGLTSAQKQRLIAEFPHEVGNTDGVPWEMRMEANRLNIARAIGEQQNLLAQSDEDKLLAIAREADPDRSPDDKTLPALMSAAMRANPSLRETTLAKYDEAVNQRIDFYSAMLGKVDDPTGQSAEPIDRQIVAFDPARSSFIELTGNLKTANHIGVFVPGVNTTVLSSGSNLETTRRLVEAGKGDVAMLTYVGGPFPDAGTISEYPNAADPRYALAMAPRLVAFSEDVNRVADGLGRDVSVTVIGHSYGGSILGTAESMGLTADRTLYVAAAGAGVGVNDPSDWHNSNADVVRYAMTAPGDWIENLQGINLGFGPHGADVDEMPGVIRLETGDYDDGRPLEGWDSHGDIVNEPSQAWDNMLAVITGGNVIPYTPPTPMWPTMAGPVPLPFDPWIWPFRTP